MESYQLTIAALSLLCLLLGVNALTTLTNRVSTTVRRSTIVGIDETGQTLTILTKEGQSRTLPVADPTILTVTEVSTGDQVSIELGRNDRINKIIKLAG